MLQIEADVDDVLDVTDEPERVSASLEGHRPYVLDKLVPYFGSKQVKRLAKALAKAFSTLEAASAAVYFKPFRMFMFVGGVEAGDGSGDTAMFRALRENAKRDLTADNLRKALGKYYRRLVDGENFELTLSTNVDYRCRMMEGLNRVCTLLADVGFFPKFVFKFKFPERQRGTRTKVLADLYREAGRSKAATDWLEDEMEIVRENTELLATLREELAEVFTEQLARFREGQSFINSEEYPSVRQIDDALARNRYFRGKILGDPNTKHRLAVAVKLYAAIVYEGFKPQSLQVRLQEFYFSAGGQNHIKDFVGATVRAMTAGVHILIIDTGWNQQSADDLAADPFIGTVVRGAQTIQTVASVKARSGDLKISAPLSDKEAVKLPTKGPDGKISGVEVIKAYREMSSRYRAWCISNGHEQEAERLWLARDAKRSTPTTGASYDEWYVFLGKLKENTQLGGLPITKRVLRKTFLNIAAANGSFSHRLSQALSNHSTYGATNLYFTQATLESRFDALARVFIELWESVAVFNIDEAALKLGISEENLQDRQRLGISSGLDFALPMAREVDAPDGSNSIFSLEESDRTFVPSDASMEELYIAQLALEKAEPPIQANNIGRWLRMWLPWSVIIETITEKLHSGRHKVAFARVMQAVNQRLHLGTLALPVVW